MAAMEGNSNYSRFVEGLKELDLVCPSCKLEIELAMVKYPRIGRKQYNLQQPNNNLLYEMESCCGTIVHLQCLERILVSKATQERKVCPNCFVQISEKNRKEILNLWKNQNKIKSSNSIKVKHERHTENLIFRPGTTLKCTKYKTDYQCEVVDARMGWTLVKYNEIDTCWEKNMDLQLVHK